MLLIVLDFHPSNVRAQGTAFSYQGQLNSNAGLANGYYDFRFDVFSDSTSGTLVCGPVTNTLVTVSNVFAEAGNAANLAGTVPVMVLNGVNGSGLTGLNASQLSTGIVPGDVAYTDVNQTFTGTNSFNQASMDLGSNITPTPGAILSAYNDAGL